MKFKIKVKPSSGKQEVVKVSDKEYKVCLKKSAQDGKANQELVKFLRKHFKKDVTIKSGLNSRNKVVELD